MSETLRRAARNLLSVLDLPGDGAPDVTSARLRTIGNVEEEHERVTGAVAVLQTEIERDPIPPWLHPDRDKWQRWVALARTFPTLRDDPRLAGYEFQLDLGITTLVRERPHMGAGKRAAVDFLAHVLMPSREFNVVAAMRAWDDAHRAAFAAWAADPWWP